MTKLIVSILINKIIEAIKEAISDYLRVQREKKADDKSISEINKIKDPKERAIAFKSWLNS